MDWVGCDRENKILETFSGEDAEAKAEAWLESRSTIPVFAGLYITTREEYNWRASKAVQDNKAATGRVSKVLVSVRTSQREGRQASHRSGRIYNRSR